MLSVFASLVLSDVWPNMGIHDGDNKVVWTVGCCDGDLITVDFRDEVGDGNGGNGLLKIYNKTSGLTSSYYLGPFYGTWKAFGPYCAPQCPSENPNCHNLTFTSDANAHETTVTVTDSFGLIKGKLGFRYQFYPREELEDQLIEPPQDVKIDGIPLTVWDNSDADALPPW